MIAHTNADPSYPGFINISRQEDGLVRIVVRGDPDLSGANPQCSEMVSLTITADVWERLRGEPAS